MRLCTKIEIKSLPKNISADGRAGWGGHQGGFGQLLLKIGRQSWTPEDANCLPGYINSNTGGLDTFSPTSSSVYIEDYPTVSNCFCRQRVVLRLWREIPSHHCLPPWPRPRTAPSSSSRRTLWRRRRSRPRRRRRRLWRRRRWRRHQVDPDSPVFDQTLSTKTLRPSQGAESFSLSIVLFWLIKNGCETRHFLIWQTSPGVLREERLHSVLEEGV